MFASVVEVFWSLKRACPGLPLGYSTAELGFPLGLGTEAL